MFHIIYLSTSLIQFDRVQLDDLLLKARQSNERHNITGALFYKDGCFLQVVEGEEDDVIFTFDRIRADSRHSGWITLFKRPILARSFGDWSMAFQDLERDDFTTPRGYNGILNRKWNPGDLAAYPNELQAFMKMFF